MRPAQEQERVNVDFPLWMIHSLDREARRLGVTRQSIIKLWPAERLKEAPPGRYYHLHAASPCRFGQRRRRAGGVVSSARHWRSVPFGNPAGHGEHPEDLVVDLPVAGDGLSFVDVEGLPMEA